MVLPHCRANDCKRCTDEIGRAPDLTFIFETRQPVMLSGSSRPKAGPEIPDLPATKRSFKFNLEVDLCLRKRVKSTNQVWF